MADHKVLIFGSFTEDETKLFQSPVVQQSPAQPFVNIDLQFGSLDAVSLNSVKGLGAEPSSSAPLVISRDAQSPSLVTKNTSAPLVVSRDGQSPNLVAMDTSAPLVVSRDAQSPNLVTKDLSFANGKSSESTGLLKLPNLVTKNKTFANGKSSESNGLPKSSKSKANGCLSLSGVTDIENNTLDVNSLHLCENRLDNAVTPGVDPKLTDAVTVVNEGSKSNILTNTSALVKPATNVQKKPEEQTLSAKSLVPRGLINSGNLCFLNATLQALLSCSPFMQLLQDLATRDIPKIGYPTLLAFVKFITDYGMTEDSTVNKHEKVIQSGKPFSPVMFDSVLRIFTPTCLSGRTRQEDAQEFLSFVMDRMHDELLKLEGHISSSNGGTLPLVSSSEDDGWETVGPKNKSAVTRTQSFIRSELSAIFGGELRSVVKARGNKASATVQPFLLLHLDILPDAVHTIKDALHLFSAPETLEGYRTSAGKAAVVSASKSVKIQTLSKILILHLMRFSYGSTGSTKLHKPVRFPLELVLARDLLVSPSSEGRRYELVATITHHGQEPSKGHYTADTRSSDGQWLRCDDSSVTVVHTNKVLHDQAYVLFYKQV